MISVNDYRCGSVRIGVTANSSFSLEKTTNVVVILIGFHFSSFSGCSIYRYICVCVCYFLKYPPKALVWYIGSIRFGVRTPLRWACLSMSQLHTWISSCVFALAIRSARYSTWLVVSTPLKNMTSSVGICWDYEIPNWYGKSYSSHVPKHHQPGKVVFLPGWNPYWTHGL